MRISLLVFVSIVGWMKTVSLLYQPADDKIVGGSPLADTRLTPHVTSLEIQNTSSGKWNRFCGGSIFSRLYVITACHCVGQVNKTSGELIPLVRYLPLENWRFVAGTAYLQNFDESYQLRTPQSISHHPRCQLESQGFPFMDNDVAVAKMAQPFSFNDYVKPVRIFSLRREEFEIELDKLMRNRQPPYCIVAGWGTTKSQSILEFLGVTTSTTETPSNSSEIEVGPGEDENRLKIARLCPMYEGECLVKLVMAFAPVIRGIDLGSVRQFGLKLHHQICALSKHHNESVCKGDSGSGLICDGFFVGVVSWGIGCANSAPDVFQGIPVTLDWLRQEVCAIQNCADLLKIPRQCNSTSLDNQILNYYLEKCYGPGKTTMRHANTIDGKYISSVTTTILVRAHQT